MGMARLSVDELDEKSCLSGVLCARARGLISQTEFSASLLAGPGALCASLRRVDGSRILKYLIPATFSP